LVKARKATAGTAASSHPDTDGRAQANCADSDNATEHTSTTTGYVMRLPTRRRRRRMSSTATVGVSSEATAFAHPNQSPVPAGALCIVQSCMWEKEAAPAITPMPAMMTA
jgi:hypothetical protein